MVESSQHHTLHLLALTFDFVVLPRSMRMTSKVVRPVLRNVEDLEVFLSNNRTCLRYVSCGCPPPRGAPAFGAPGQKLTVSASVLLLTIELMTL